MDTSDLGGQMGPGINTAVVEAMPVASAMMDADGKIVAWNPMMESLTGKPATEVVGKRAWAGFFAKRKSTPLDEALAEGEPVEEEIELAVADRSATVMVKAVPWFDGGTKPAGVFATAVCQQDTSELQALKAEAAHQAGQLRCLFAICCDMADQGSPIEDSLARLVAHLPAAWTHPEVCCARVVHKDYVLTTEGFSQSQWKLASELPCGGVLEVFYTQQRPDSDEGPFRSDERKLLDFIAMRLSDALTRRGEKQSTELAMQEIAQLIGAAFQGELSLRASAESYGGEWAELLYGINQMLDAIVGPLRTTAQCVNQIAQGRIPDRIEVEGAGEFGQLYNSVNACIDGLGGLVEANSVLQRMAVNDYSVKVSGTYQGVYADVGIAVNNVNEHINHLIGIVRSVGMGDLSDLEALKALNGGQGRRSDNDELVPSLILMMENVRRMVSEAVRLSEAAKQGLLSTRADATMFDGEFRKVLLGVNDTLEAVIGPLHVAASYVDEISKGNMPAKITDSYQGDFNVIKDNLNTCIDAVTALVEDANALS